MKYVITGGPCTGKTTMLEALKNEGYSIIPEAARKIISEEKLVPWVCRKGFQKRIIEVQLDLESRINGGLTFLDRGLPDNIAYFRVDGVPVDQELIDICKGRYDKIFLLEPLKMYVNDYARKENKEIMIKIHSEIEKIYRELNYKIISVPVLQINERKKFIIKNIG